MDDHLRYDYAGDRRVLEGADWIGCRPSGLRLHYHAEVQVSVIWNGCRDYVIGRQRLRLFPGQVLVIGPLQAHRALPSRSPLVTSAEFYFAPESLPALLGDRLGCQPGLLADVPALLEIAPRTVGDFVVGGMNRDAFDWTGAAPAAVPSVPEPMAGMLAAAGGVAAAASLAGLSREGFTRAFSRRVGMTPHAYGLNLRLNAGRQMLRDGLQISDAAYAAGFCDQSHFGRMFLAFFGATPGQFRAAHHLT